MFLFCGQIYDSFEILPPTSDIKEFRFVLNEYKNNDYFVFYFTPKSEKCRDIQILINKKYNHLLSRFFGGIKMNIFLEDIKKIKFKSMEMEIISDCIAGRRLACICPIMVNDLHYIKTKLKLPISIYNNNYNRWYDLQDRYSLKFLKTSKKAICIYSRIYGV